MASRHGCAEATEGGGRGGRSAGLAWQPSRQPERKKGRKASRQIKVIYRVPSSLSSSTSSWPLGRALARSLARSLSKVINAACKLEGLAVAAAGLTVPYCTVLHFLSFRVGKSDWAKTLCLNAMKIPWKCNLMAFI